METSIHLHFVLPVLEIWLRFAMHFDGKPDDRENMLWPQGPDQLFQLTALLVRQLLLRLARS